MNDIIERYSQPCGKTKFVALTKRERVPIEATNGVKQFDYLLEILTDYLKSREEKETYHFYLRTSHLIDLNRIAVDELIENPGSYRQEKMQIKGSGHRPPDWKLVPTLIDELCEYVNSNWHLPAIHLSAYVMWRLNWIHPFIDGNGRTARAASYLVLCARLRRVLPGERTIPDFISENKVPYYEALEKADQKWAKGKIDLSAMERLILELLERQIVGPISDSASRESIPVSSIDEKSIEETSWDIAAPQKYSIKLKVVLGALSFSAIIFAAVITARCNSAVCVPNSQVPCQCENLEKGYQTCNFDGDFFSNCNCVPLAIDPHSSKLPDAGDVNP